MSEGHGDQLPWERCPTTGWEGETAGSARHHCLLGGTWGLGSALSGCWSPGSTATVQDGKEGAKAAVKMIGKCRASTSKNVFSLHPYGLSSGSANPPAPQFS